MSKKTERHKFILHELNVHNRILLTDLSLALNISTDTLRRDIKELHNQGKLKQVHGGAVSMSYDPVSIRSGSVYAHTEKIAIARKCLDLIQNDSVILISGGTTNVELAKLLPAELHCTFFTPSLIVAQELISHPNIEVIFIGGKLSKESQISIGGSALNTLSGIKVDQCFLGTGHLHPLYGLTEFDWEVVQMKKAMIKAARRTICLGISEKLNSTQRYQICNISKLDMLITELEPDDVKLDTYRSQEIKIL